MLWLVASHRGRGAAAPVGADRGRVHVGALPQVSEAATRGSAGLAGIYQATDLSVLTTTYRNGFCVVGILCVLGMGLVLTLRSGPVKAGGPVHVEM